MDFKETIDAIARKTKREEADARRQSLIRLDAPATKPEVGLWWLIEGRIFRIAQRWQDTPLEDDFHMIEDEHIHAWATMQAALKARVPSVVPLRYNDPERGRVWYKPTRQEFFITCSKPIKADHPIIRLIITAFGIDNQRLLVVNDPQYDVRPSSATKKPAGQD